MCLTNNLVETWKKTERREGLWKGPRSTTAICALISVVDEDTALPTVSVISVEQM